MMEAIQWAVGILVTLQTGVIGFLSAKLWAHVEKCAHVSAELARLEADVERMKQDIGTHDSGMRGEIHQAANMCQQHELRIINLERA
jgi:hypothetical protein